MKRSNYISILTISFILFSTISKPNDQVYQDYSVENPSSHIATPEESVPSIGVDEQFVGIFFTPINFSKNGINFFLKDVFNNNEYKKLLPHNLDHIKYFLTYGAKTNQGLTYPQAVLRLFSSKLKETSYVNAYNFEDFLKTLPQLVKKYFTTKEDSTDKHEEIKNIIYKNFMNKFDIFKEQPAVFVSSLAKEIEAIFEIESKLKQKLEEEKLRQLIIRFVDLNLNKIVWSPYDNDDIWENIKEVGSSIKQLHTANIVTNPADINDMYRSLTFQFCKFLDLAGSDLSLEFYQKVADDINANSVEFVEQPEKEDIKSKKQHIIEAIIEGNAKAHAKNYGIVSEPIAG